MSVPVGEGRFERILEAADLAAQATAAHTVVLYRMWTPWRLSIPRPVGTGVAVLMQGEHYLFTAAHVLDALLTSGRVYMSPGAPRRPPVQLLGAATARTPLPPSRGQPRGLG